MKTKYRQLCEQELSIPLFSRDWWLDAVCGEHNWDVVAVEKDNHLIATMPYFLVKRYGFQAIVQPPLTQTMGPWLKTSTAKYSKSLGQQKDYMSELIDKLPKFSFFSQNWFYKNTNWLPFFWKGFQQTSRVTYRLEDLSNIDLLYKNFDGKVRTEIKKAEKLGVKIKSDPTIDEFINLNEMVFRRQGLTMPYSSQLVRQIHNACDKRKQCKIFLAEDEDGNAHAGVYIVWDENSAYYLMGGGDPKLRNSGATSLCMWEAIKFSSQVTNSFDFEGSMIESVERFCRSFGAKQVSYHSLSKINSKLLMCAKSLKTLIK